MSGGAQMLSSAAERASAIGRSAEYESFLGFIRNQYPGAFDQPSRDVERDYLRVVDQHLQNLIPYVQRHITPATQQVLDFGCGSGGSAIALTMVYPWITCTGTDIDSNAISVARERAKLYGVADRCKFRHVSEGQALPFANETFDFSLCSSVLEYAVAPGARRFCVREMARLVKQGGLLFFSVPNGIYPMEIHTRKWGWNYFPSLLKARTVDTTYWEIRRLARPCLLTLHRTPIAHLLRPWSAFCVKKQNSVKASASTGRAARSI